MGRLRRAAGLSVAAIGAGIGLAPACSVEVASLDPNDVAQHREPLLSPWGAEKLIPLRFVNLVGCVPTSTASCTPPLNCGDDNICYDILLDSVTKANEVFKSAGVQFYVSSVERYLAGAFVNAGGPNVTWSTAWPQLSPVLPNMPNDAWLGGTEKRPFEWLQATAAVYAPNHQILVWIVNASPSHNARQPEQGRNVLMIGPWWRTEPYKLAHELGHFMGLPHTWAITGTPKSQDLFGGVDPETLATRKKADFWDLVYKPGTSDANPHVFYTNFAAASADEPNLQAIQQSPCKVHCASGALGCNCQYSQCGQPGCGAGCCQCCGNGECDSCIEGTPPSLLTCHVGSASYGKSYTNGHSEIKGHARIVNGAYSVNVMSYRGDFKTHPYFLSDSQIHLMRKYLRWDVPTAEDTGYITSGRNTGYAWIASGRRPLLGGHAFRDPLAKLDFNGDGKRDIGVWIPPTVAGIPGRVKVLLSPTFSQSPGNMIDTDFGRLGDIPVPADYDTDGKTDFAVYQPGGGTNRTNHANDQAFWRWCLTNPTPPATNCGAISQTTCLGIPSNCFAYGLRRTTPTPGLDFDGALPNEFSVYDDATATWFWQAQGGAYNFRSIGTANKGSVPLPGHYDGDFLADLVLWDPASGMFNWRRSQQSWNTAGSKFFGPDYVSNPLGNAAFRGGGLPMPIFRALTICAPACLPYKRLVFAIWRPHEGDWTTVWDPFGAGTLSAPCIFGLDRADQPFSGFDRNGDNRAEYSVYRATTFGASAEIHMKNSVAGACNGAYALRTCSSCGVGTRALTVADMTGDGKEELILIHTHTMTIEWRTSESDFVTTGGSWAVGNPLAVFL